MQRYRTALETAKLFEDYAFHFEVEAHRNNDDPFLRGKAEAYKNAAFEIKHNMKEAQND